MNHRPLIFGNHRAERLQILHAFANRYGVSVDAITGPRRTKAITEIRWRVMRAMRQHGYSLGQIGKTLRRDHTTVMYGLRRLEELEGRETLETNAMAKKFDREQKLQCILRELRMRRNVYPKWVADRRLSQADADEQIALMEAIRDDYMPPGLFDGTEHTQ